MYTMQTRSSCVWMSCGLSGLDVEVMVMPRCDAARRMRESDASPSWYDQPPSTYLPMAG